MPKHKAIGFTRDNRLESRRKVMAIDRKRERVRGLTSLLQMWEGRELSGNRTSELHSYILDVRRRLRCAKNQLQAMGEEQ